jgi:UDP-N-acetylmuramate dehydrogenase
MNAGAFGRELVDVVETVALMNGTGEIKVVHRNDLRFEYRNLDLPERMVIIGAKFLLARGSKEKIEEKVSEITGTRKERHPLEQRSAGSIFRNPPDISAGEIIEEIGLKGVKIGGAKISEVHGNFIVNSESAEAKDVLALIDLVRKKVWEERGISLKCEVKIIGED